MGQRRLIMIITALFALAFSAGCTGFVDTEDIDDTSEALAMTCDGISEFAPDVDLDGIVDACEQSLAERFAPIVYHSSDETNFPTNVDWFLPKTSLRFYDDNCWPDLNQNIENAPPQWDLPAWSYTGGCGASDTVYSGGTRSDRKQRTFFLSDVASQYRSGSPNTLDWTTYVHVYRNTISGVTIQYWRFYAYNDAANNHGGDWEGIHVVLNSALQVSSVNLLGHTTIDSYPVSSLTWEGTHPRIFSEGGGHASHTSGSGIQARCWVCGPAGCSYLAVCSIDPNNSDTFVRQETFPNGWVTGMGRTPTHTGPILNVGEKLHPMNGQQFLQYSGIWGSPGTFFETSGYWGPAYNETAMGANHFITAWCNGMSPQPWGECAPSGVSR